MKKNLIWLYETVNAEDTHIILKTEILFTAQVDVVYNIGHD